MKLTKRLRNIVMGAVLAVTMTNCSNMKPYAKVASYYDIRGMPTATLAGGASELPLKTDFFGFIDVETEKDNNENIKFPYTELKLYRKINEGTVIDGLGPAIQYDRDFSQPKGTTRIGLTYEPNISFLLKDTFIGFNAYPAATNDAGIEIGLYGKKSFNDNNFYLEGFFDYDINPNKIVTELQFGKRIWKNIYGVIEGRYNDYRDDNLGLGIGLEYIFDFTK